MHNWKEVRNLSYDYIPRHYTGFVYQERSYLYRCIQRDGIIWQFQEGFCIACFYYSLKK